MGKCENDSEHKRSSEDVAKVELDVDSHVADGDDPESSQATRRGAFKSRQRLRSLKRLVFISRLLSSTDDSDPATDDTPDTPPKR